MKEDKLVCAKCGGAMDEGLVLDITYRARRQSEWLEGAPESSRWAGVKIEGKEHLPVATFRCRKCGYLESYAPLG